MSEPFLTSSTPVTSCPEDVEASLDISSYLPLPTLLSTLWLKVSERGEKMETLPVQTLQGSFNTQNTSTLNLMACVHMCIHTGAGKEQVLPGDSLILGGNLPWGCWF